MSGAAVVELNQQRDSSLVTRITRHHELLTDQMASDHSNPSSSAHNNPSTVKHAPRCNHFSIRGFVAEVRKRDPNLCDPFTPHGSLHDSIREPQHVLPPMEVPNFRWWKCVGCVPEAAEGGPNGTANEEAPIILPADFDVADVPIPQIGQTSNPPKGRTSEACASTDSNDNRNMPLTVLCADPKGKGKAHAEDVFPPATVVIGSRFNENGLTVSRLEDCRNDRVEIGAPEEYVNRKVNDIADEIRGEKSRGCSNAQPGDSRTNIDVITDKVTEIVHQPSNDEKGASSVALPDLNACSGEPPFGGGDKVDDNKNDGDDNDDDDEKNDTDVITLSVLCEDDDDYLGPYRRKTPKVRLLSDLLGLTGNKNDPKAKKKNLSSSVLPSGMATCRNMTSDSLAQLPINGTAKRKRSVGSQDEESSKSTEIRGIISNGNKRLRMLYETSESESEDKSIDQIMMPETMTKRRSKLGKTPFVEKAAKRIKVDNGATSSMPRKRTILPRSSHEKAKSCEKQLVVYTDVLITEKAVQNVISDRVTDIPPESNVSAPMSERNSGMLIKKKKPKMPQSGKQICKNHVPRECSTVRNSDEALQKRSEDIQSEQLRQDGSSRKGIDHFPKSYSPVGNGHIRIPIPVKDGFHSLPPWAEPMIPNGHFPKKPSENRSIGETSSAFRPPLTTRVGGNGERISISTTNSKWKQVWVPEAQESGGPRTQQRAKQVCDSVANEKEVATGVRGRQDIDINSIPTEDKVAEQATGDRDDIPMEIVELLAKNQYERNLRDPKDHQHYPVTLTNNGKNVRSNGNGYGENIPMFWQSHILSMPNAIATDSRNMVNRFDEMGPTKRKMFGPFSDYNHINHPHCMSSDYPMSLSPQAQDHIPSYHGGGYSVGKQRSPPSFLHDMESYNTLRGSSPRQNIETHAWPRPPMISRRMPMGITNPDMISQKSPRAHNPSQRPTILNFNLGRQNNTGFSNGYSNYCGNPESSVSGKHKGGGGGSADLYSNEAISAMHLLSLMQAKSQPSTLSSMDGKPGGILKRNMAHNHEIGPQKMGASSSSSRQLLLQNQGGNHPCYPTAGFAFTSSLQNNNGGMGRNSGFISPIPLTSKGQRSIESSHFPNPRQLVSSVDKGKGAMLSPSSVNPSHSNPPNNLFGLGTKRDERTVSKAPQTEICTVNRNPSDFNDLTELRKYMIGPDDLKPKRIKRGRPRGDAKKQENQNRVVKKHIHNHTAKESRKC